MSDDRIVHIGPLTIPTRTHHAEVNGCQVITKTAMPEPVLNALAALVDALGAAFRQRDDDEREADAELTRRACPAHLGQYAAFCGPCLTKKLAAKGRGMTSPAHLASSTCGPCRRGQHAACDFGPYMPCDCSCRSRAVLCEPPEGCTCPDVAWYCCCKASEHGRAMAAGLACDCGPCQATRGFR